MRRRRGRGGTAWIGAATRGAGVAAGGVADCRGWWREAARQILAARRRATAPAAVHAASGSAGVRAQRRRHAFAEARCRLAALSPAAGIAAAGEDLRHQHDQCCDQDQRTGQTFFDPAFHAIVASRTRRRPSGCSAGATVRNEPHTTTRSPGRASACASAMPAANVARTRAHRRTRTSVRQAATA